MRIFDANVPGKLNPSSGLNAGKKSVVSESSVNSLEADKSNHINYR